jgi:hypothetical protein
MRCYSIPDALSRLRRTDTAANRRWLKDLLESHGGFVAKEVVGEEWLTGNPVVLKAFCGPADLVDTLSANGGERRQGELAL